MKIGLLTPGWPGTQTPNGIATSVRCLASGLHDIGHVPVVIGNLDGPPPEGLPFVALSPPKWRLRDRLCARVTSGDTVHVRRQADAIATAIRAAKERHGLDALIMEETRGWAGFVAGSVSVPVIANLHGPWEILSGVLGRPLGSEDRKRIELESRAFGRVAGLMAPSRVSLAVTDGIAQRTPRALIRNALAPAPVIGAGERLDWHVLFVGRAERLKGADTVLSAFEILAARRPQSRLTFVGPDNLLVLDDGRAVPMAEALKALAPETHSKIDYLGRRSPLEIEALRRTHPVAVIASRFENLNYSMLESIAARQALVCTKVGGPAEVLEDGITASLVPPGDPVAMADALERLLGDGALRERQVKAALDLLEREFHPNAVAAQTLDFCRRVLAGPTHL